MKLEPRHERPLALLQRIESTSPECWAHLAHFREGKGKPPLPDWPAWCFLPIAAGMAVATEGAPLHALDYDTRMRGAGLAAPLVAGAAWRISKGIWDFDEALHRHLWETPLEGEIPVEALYRLPEWCPYLCLRGAELAGELVHGALVWLEHDPNDGRAELRLLFDMDGALPGVALHLDQRTVEACLQESRYEGLRQADAQGRDVTVTAPQLLAAERTLAPLVSRVLSLVLYLCSSEPDLTRKLPPRPGSGRKLSPVPQQQPTVWPVGLRIGAALREYERAESERGEPTGRGVRPHMRRAHWHHYWVGKGRSEIALRWVAPVAVGSGEAPAVVRPVR